MKKLLSIFVLFFAFTLSASAQTEKRKPTPEENAKQNTFEVSKAIEISADLQASLYKLFVKKHTELSKEGITENEKQEVYKTIDAKLKATFSDEQIKKLESTDGLYDRLLK